MQSERNRNNRSARNAGSYTYVYMKYKIGNRHFWSRGYYVSTVGGNKQAVTKKKDKMKK